MRVSISAIGSQTLINFLLLLTVSPYGRYSELSRRKTGYSFFLPTRLFHARQLAFPGQVPEAYPAHINLAVVGVPATAELATIISAGFILRFFLLFIYQTLTSQSNILS